MPTSDGSVPDGRPVDEPVRVVDFDDLAPPDGGVGDRWDGAVDDRWSSGDRAVEVVPDEGIAGVAAPDDRSGSAGYRVASFDDGIGARPSAASGGSERIGAGRDGDRRSRTGRRRPERRDPPARSGAVGSGTVGSGTVGSGTVGSGTELSGSVGSGTDASGAGSSPEQGRRRGAAGASSRTPPEQDDETRAREICLRLLTDRARTVKELGDALRRKEIPDDVADRVLRRFDEVGLVDDEAFTGQWVRSRHQQRGLGRRAIAQELRRKGVEKEVADAALSEIDTDSETARARELVDRKLRTLRVGTRDERAVASRRLVGMLARKGYGGGTAYAVVREAIAARGADVDELGEEPGED